MTRRTICLAAAVLATAMPATFAGTLVRIGDIDGFGYGTAANFKNSSGGNANADGLGVLTSGDRLPDINRDRAVATGRGDEFDFRSEAELANNAIAIGTGVVDAGTVGSKYTDISLARTYDDRSRDKMILIGGNPGSPDTRVFGAGRVFPDGDSESLTNQPGFLFNFTALKANYDPSNPIFFNLIFGDYDVLPAQIVITRADNTTKTIGLVRQGTGQDGLIQAATATLNFADVFTSGGPTVWNGKLRVDFDAPNEPYTAFDYVELSTTALVAVPEPAALTSGIIGALLVGGFHLRRRRAA